MANAGVPFLKIMDTYESVMQRSDRIVLVGVDVEKHQDEVSALLELLAEWVTVAQSRSRATGKNTALQELERAIASGRLAKKFDSIRAGIEMLPAETGFMDDLLAIEDRIRLMA